MRFEHRNPQKFYSGSGNLVGMLGQGTGHEALFAQHPMFIFRLFMGKGLRSFQLLLGNRQDEVLL